MNGRPSIDNPLTVVRFSTVSDVIFFSSHNSIAEGCFLKIEPTPTHLSCCSNEESGNLQHEHTSCKRRQPRIMANKQATVADVITSNSEGETKFTGEQIPFSHLLIDTAQAMPLTDRLQCYAKIVRFQIRKYLNCLKDETNHLSQHKQRSLFAKLNSELLTRAHEMAVYPFSAYYVPLLIGAIRGNTAPESKLHQHNMLTCCTKFTHNNGVAQRFFLRGLEDSDIVFNGLNLDQADSQHNQIRRVCDTLNQLYLIDVLDKLPILTWYRDDTHTGEGLQDHREYHQVYANLPYFFCPENASTRRDFVRAKQLRHLARPFVNWLKSTRDEDDETEENKP